MHRTDPDDAERSRAVRARRFSAGGDTVSRAFSGVGPLHALTAARLIAWQPLAGNGAVAAALGAVQRQAHTVQRRSVVTESHARMQSAFGGGATTIKNFGPLVKVFSPVFKAEGSVTVTKDAVDSGEYEVGFVQAMRASSGLIGHYYTGTDADGRLDASGDPYKQSRQDYTKSPARDGEPNLIPWYGPEAMTPVTGLVTEVTMSDQPQGALVMESPDHMAALGQVIGTEQFISWLAIRHTPSGTLTPLWYITWSVDYAGAVDPKSSEGTPFGHNTVDEVLEGTGPMAPITSGPVANDLRGKTVWSTWS